MAVTTSAGAARAPRWGPDLAWVFGAGVLLTAAMGWPVLLRPAEWIFGRAFVGAHADPFVVMAQMAGAGPDWPYVQPLTDWVGWVLGRALPPVAAYNVVVLMTFPLTMTATWALARYLGASVGAAWFAGVAVAYAPAHLAQAAYHPHIAQTHWLPIYFLALFAAIDRPTARRGVLLLLAAAGLALANFYGGLIGAVLTPVAAPLYWWHRADGPRRWRALVVPMLWVAVPSAVAVGAISLVTPALFGGDAYARPIDDLVRYSARWWSYLLPPLEHPLLGDYAVEAFGRGGIPNAEWLEQQLSLGWSLVALAAVGLGAGITGSRRSRGSRLVIPLAVLALVAGWVSVGPGTGSCLEASWAPACRVHEVLPMFRAYARFGLVVQLVVALLAAFGLMWLRGRSRAGAALALLLVAGTAFEYWPWPARARDVLPTSGHRWLARQQPGLHVLECLPRRASDVYVSWLMGQSVGHLGPQLPACEPPEYRSRLAALGYTHVLIRHPRGRPAVFGEAPLGVTAVFDAPDALVYEVDGPRPDVAIVADRGFYEHERRGDDWWRWMGTEAVWVVQNAADGPREATLEVWLESAGGPRVLEVRLDGVPVGTFEVGMSVARVVGGPWTLAPGDHELRFVPRGAPARPAGDARALTVAFRRPVWRVVGTGGQ